MRLEDGCLVLETHFEKFANNNYKKSPSDWIKNTKFMPYTSGSVTTIKTKNFMFGRLEAVSYTHLGNPDYPDDEATECVKPFLNKRWIDVPAIQWYHNACLLYTSRCV